MLSCNKWKRGLWLAAALLGVFFGVPRTRSRTNRARPADAKGGEIRGRSAPAAGGLFAEEETDVEFHVADASQDDPVQGAPPIVKAKVAARVTMPTMAAMPAQSPKTHTEGVPGDYGVVLYFPHGGEYQIDLTITPPGDKAFTVSYKVPVGDAQAAKGRKASPNPTRWKWQATRERRKRESLPN